MSELSIKGIKDLKKQYAWRTLVRHFATEFERIRGKKFATNRLRRGKWDLSVKHETNEREIHPHPATIGTAGSLVVAPTTASAYVGFDSIPEIFILITSMIMEGSALCEMYNWY